MRHTTYHLHFLLQDGTIVTFIQRAVDSLWKKKKHGGGAVQPGVIKTTILCLCHSLIFPLCLSPLCHELLSVVALSIRFISQLVYHSGTFPLVNSCGWDGQ